MQRDHDLSPSGLSAASAPTLSRDFLKDYAGAAQRAEMDHVRRVRMAHHEAVQRLDLPAHGATGTTMPKGPGHPGLGGVGERPYHDEAVGGGGSEPETSAHPRDFYHNLRHSEQQLLRRGVASGGGSRAGASGGRYHHRGRAQSATEVIGRAVGRAVERASQTPSPTLGGVASRATMAHREAGL